MLMSPAIPVRLNRSKCRLEIRLVLVQGMMRQIGYIWAQPGEYDTLTLTVVLGFRVRVVEVAADWSTQISVRAGVRCLYNNVV